MIHRASYTLVLLALIGGCRRHTDAGPLVVSVIGPELGSTHATPDRTTLDAPAAQLLAATGQGLVRFDAAGQIVPGLAARWIVSDEGRSLIFRLPDLPVPGARPIDAGQIARRIRSAIAPASRNPLKPLLGAIDEIDAVTPQVIDIELKAPRPNMLQLFAQPTLAFGGVGHGPFVVGAMRSGAAILCPLADADPDPDEEAAIRPPMVMLRGEPPGRAVARFVAGQSDLLLGGRFSDLAIARAAEPKRGTLRFDPVDGLFGLAFVANPGGVTGDVDVRRALAMAVDRDRIARILDVPGWKSATAIVASGTPEITEPAIPTWTGMGLADRQNQARRIVADWLGAHRSAPALRVAMPPGPGARALFTLIADDWRRIGVAAVAVDANAPADLRLIDEVAPADVASFYLRAFACDRQVPCTTATDRLLTEARDAQTLPERRVLLTQADALITGNAPFITFGPPIRWSLVAPRLDLYRDSPRALHPLNELRSPLKR
jgi:peptide/nickel transport system substrate-binding protein